MWPFHKHKWVASPISRDIYVLGAGVDRCSCGKIRGRIFVQKSSDHTDTVHLMTTEAIKERRL